MGSARADSTLSGFPEPIDTTASKDFEKTSESLLELFKHFPAQSFKFISVRDSIFESECCLDNRRITMKVQKVLRWAIVSGMTLLLAVPWVSSAHAQNFLPLTTNPAGEYGGTPYTVHFGLFMGTTAKGDFIMPYQIFAPTNPDDGNGVVLFEPSHWAYGPAIGRDVFLGRELLFSRGFSHASVGFSELQFNILAPIPGLMIAGAPATQCDPYVVPGCTAIRDVEIIKQFNVALTTDPDAQSILGSITSRYAYGSSQTSEVLLEMMYGSEIEGLFDFMLLTLTLWELKIPTPATGQVEPGVIPEEFTPVNDVGKVMFVNSEGDLMIANSKELRAAAGHPDYRLYEVAGAPHFASIYLTPQPPILNPLDAAPVARAAFIAGHHWVSEGVDPPPDALLAPTPNGQVDPVHADSALCGPITEIARDVNGNALGGVKLPELAAGRGTYVACTEAASILGLPLLGLFDDLACEPASSSDGDQPRFRNHGAYIKAIARQASLLVQQRYLLPEDAEIMVENAGQSDVGKPHTCP